MKITDCPSAHRYVTFTGDKKVCKDCGTVIEQHSINDELKAYIRRRLRVIDALLEHPRLTK